MNNQPDKNPKKEVFDDGRTIADMNVDGFRWYVPTNYKKARTDLQNMQITKEERRAMIRGALQAILPLAGLVIVLSFFAFWLMYLWLS